MIATASSSAARASALAAGSYLFCQEFPSLRNLDVAQQSSSVRAHVLAGIVNSTSESQYLIARLRHLTGSYALRVAGIGDQARFFWADRAGTVFGEGFDELEIGETARFIEWLNSTR